MNIFQKKVTKLAKKNHKKAYNELFDEFYEPSEHMSFFKLKKGKSFVEFALKHQNYNGFRKEARNIIKAGGNN